MHFAQLQHQLTDVVAATAQPVLMPAHGVGSREDLPLPFGFLLAGAAAALVISFAALALFWRSPRLNHRHGRRLPVGINRLLNSKWVRGAAVALSLTLAGWTLAALTFGSDNATNPAPHVIYVWLWIGIVGLSLLLGPVWVLLNPLRWLHLGLCRLARVDPDGHLLRYRAGHWPAAAGLFAFTWLELIAPDRTSRSVLGVAVAAFIAVSLLGAFVFGRRWFALADPFEVLSRLYGALSPLARAEDGAWLVRNPLTGLDLVRSRRGLLPAVSVMLGGTAYDGFSGNIAWFTFAQSSPLPVLTQTGGLLGMCLLVAGTVWVTAQLSAYLAQAPGRGVATAFGPSLIPIAAGYAIAHYWSVAIYSGQYTLTLLTDPLGIGANWLGSAGLEPNAALIAPTLVACIQAGAIITGHLLGIVHAHERALTLFERRHALVGQLPMLALMVGYTCSGLLLLFSS